MFSQRSISRFSSRVGSLNQASRIFTSRSEPTSFHLNSLSQSYSVLSGSRNSKDHPHILANASPSYLGSLGTKLGFLKVNDNAYLPSALNFKSYIHSASPKEFESGRDSGPLNFARGVMNEDRPNELDLGKDSRPMNFVRGAMNENRPRELDLGRDSRPMNFARGVMNENRPNEFDSRQMNFARGVMNEDRPNELDLGRDSRPMNFVRGAMNENRPRELDLGRDSRPMNFARGVMNENRPNEFDSRPMNFARGVMNENRPNEFDSRPMNFVRGVMNEDRGNGFRGPQFSHQEVEKDTADIVHIKLIRNNAFVTVTDSKGNKKIGASSGCLSGKVSRYSADSTAEHVGRLARNMGLKSFVVKVNGFTFFKKKKQAILSFRDGFTNSRNDHNPIVYIEDTTRKAHNGCRLRKQRRI